MNTAQNQGARGPIFDGLLALDPRYLSTLDASGFRSSRSAWESGREGSAALPYARANGVGLIDIDGPLLERGVSDWWGCCDGHEDIAARCLAAAADPAVKVGALRINSPGGVVAGCFDNVRLARDAFAAAGKQLLVWAGGDGAYSAGYAWACAGSKIFVPETGGIGSIGVLSTMGDRVGANALAGIKRVVIRSGDRKCEGHPDIPLTDGAIGREQVVVDGMAAIFAALCASARAAAPDALLALQGECFYGDTAVSKGLADGVMPFQDFLAMCEAEATNIMTKGITGRLGLAESASEGQIITAIDGLEAKRAAADTARLTAEADRDKLANAFADQVVEEAKIAGKVTAEQALADRAAFVTDKGVGKPIALVARYELLPRGAALPREVKAPVDGPNAKGPSGQVAVEAKPAHEMTWTEIAAHEAKDHALGKRLSDEKVAHEAKTGAARLTTEMTARR